MKTILLTAIYSILLVIFSCDEKTVISSFCDNAIEENISQLDFSCYPNIDEHYLFTSENELDLFLTECSNFLNTAKPTIDFVNFDLIALRASGSGCSRTFNSKLYKCDETNTFLYKVIVTETGNCEPLETRYVFSQIPKIDNNWSVEYEVEIVN